MKKEIFYGSNKEGKPTIPRSKALKEAMLAFGDSPWQLVLSERVKPPTAKQRGYYWGCLIPAVMDGLVDIGYDRRELNEEVVNELLKDKFLRIDIISDQGEPLSVARSTKDISKSDYAVFIDDVIMWAAIYLHCAIAPPNGQAMMNFEE